MALAMAATISVPGRGAATPTVAASGATVVVAFSAADASGAADVFVAVSHDGAARFAPAVRVNDVAGAADVNGEQPPRIELADGAIVVVWTAKAARGTRLMQARSVDDGRTFSPSTVVAGSDAPGNRGWESIAGPLVLWLDHRDLAKGDGAEATQHVHGSGGSMAERSKLYIGSLDGSVAPHAITSSVCYCCKTALVSSQSTVYAAWRHVFPGSVRDIAFAVSRDGGRTFNAPVRVSDDRWVLQGCPENGPALAVDARQRAHVVWPTLTKEASGADENLALFYAQSSDAKAFTPRTRIPTEGTPRHPQVIVGRDGSLLVAWDESADGRKRVVAARATFDRSGAPAFARDVLGEGTYPTIALSESPVVAWMASDGIRVQRATPASAK